MLKNLRLQNFRNHYNYELELEQTTVLVGKNGVGKSNVLEAIVLLSFCRSFREEKKANLINYNSDFARIVGDDLELIISRFPQCTVKVRNKGVPRRTTDFIGTLTAVVFSPETMQIIVGAPTERRRFLDIMLSQVDRIYLRALVDYAKVRHQRNHLLRRIKQGLGSESELDYWDEELVKLGEIITEKRFKAIDMINKELSKIYCKISNDKKAELKLEYERRSENLRDDLRKRRARDIADERTNYGPHSDDLKFKLDDRDMENFASRGEIRSAVLALKIGELNFLESVFKESLENRTYTQPILLLDDIFSEFDAERRSHLMDLVSSYQTLITTTEKEYLSQEFLKRAKVVEIG